MFLKKIEIKNFRCLDNIKLSFDSEKSIRKQTILLGENGTGKTNLLKAIALITAGSNALGELLGNPDDWIQYGKDFCEIKAELVTKKSEERSLSITIKRGDTLKDIIIWNQKSLTEIDDAINNATRNYFVVAYGSSRRLGEERNGKYFEDIRARNISTLFNRDSVLNPLESWAIDLDYREQKAGLEVVRQTLNSFLPGITFKEIDKKKKQLLFNTKDGVIPLNYLSDGYQNMAAWIGDLLYRITSTFEDYKSPLTARGLLLVDEIDLHLHPKWQRILLDFISKNLPNFQLIATTHSPLTAQQSDKNELFYFQRDNEQIKLKKFKGTPKNLLVNQLLMTDVFGLETDESLEVEKTKEEYKNLKNKESLNKSEKKSLNLLTEKLQEIPINNRNNLSYKKKDIALLEEIKRELANQK